MEENKRNLRAWVGEKTAVAPPPPGFPVLTALCVILLNDFFHLRTSITRKYIYDKESSFA